MKFVWLLVLIFAHDSVWCFDNRIVQTFKDVRDDPRMSDQCSNALDLYLQNLNSTDDRWALKMLDATSKIPVGLLFSYNFGELGEFDQCLDTESNDGLIKGKYCSGTISLEASIALGSNLEVLKRQAYVKQASRIITGIQTRNAGDVVTVGPPWAICLPSDCTDLDAIEILNTLIGSQSALCQTKEDLSPPLTPGAIATIVIFAFFGYLLVASTIYDLFHVYSKTEPRHEIFVAFSIYRNGRKLFKISNTSDQLSCLNGIRFFSMAWVIIGHVYSMASGGAPVSNFIAILNWADSLYSMIFVSGTLSVDSFFFISGLLVVYGFMKAKHNGVTFNIFKFYLHRYLRLTPALAAAILISSTLLKYMGSGPLWSYTDASLEEPCRRYWWTTLLYIQNYANDQQQMCVAQTWYLSVDMQLYVLSPLILIPLWKFPKIGLGLIAACILAFIITPFFVAYNNYLIGVISNIAAGQALLNTMATYYTKTHTRAAPWFIGALVGYVLAIVKFQKQKKLIRNSKNEKIIVTLLWGACIALLLTCVFGGHSTLRSPDYDRWGNAFHIALVRPVWAIALGWVVFACVLGYGGPINWFLSLSIYQVLNRFTYSIYLIHYSVLNMILFSTRRGTYFSDFNMAYSFWGITMLSFGLSVLWVLAFESPIIIIEKLIFRTGKRRVENRQTRKEDNADP